MYNKIKVILKNNPRIYTLYNQLFSFLLKMLGCLVKIDNKMILFNSFGGKKYDDSPKAIYEYMKKSNKYNDYKMYWVFDNPDDFNIKGLTKIKNNTLKFFIVALKSKYWITNSSLERGLKFKKKKTIYINTWHGSAIKKLGSDVKSDSYKFNVSKPDVMYAQSKYDIKTLSKAFDYKESIFVLSGLPRNDELNNIKEEEITKIKNKLGINKEKKVILYAPTFREFDYDKNGCFLAPPIDIKKWEKELSKDYILLFRAHYEVNKVLNIKNNNFILNVTEYPNLNELLKISDILISDYSSIIIDYSILERPIFNYVYDYEKYKEKRGLYIDIEKEYPNGIQRTEKELLEQIKKCDYKEQSLKIKKFKNKYVEKYGNASKYIDKILKEVK